MTKFFHDLLKQDWDKFYFTDLAFGVIDFNHSKFSTLHLNRFGKEEQNYFFDLASLTKPLTMGAYDLLNPTSDEKEISLLEHRSGLPAWGRLGPDWKKQIQSYEIKGGNTVYSDFGALRFQLEIEKKTGRQFQSLCSHFWDNELFFWKDLKSAQACVATGFRRGNYIAGAVHDDNCFVINEFTVHAGLFATPKGLAQSLLNLQKETDFITKMNSSFSKKKERFLRGWDTKSTDDKSLAGTLCSEKTFGHLGFVGNSLWIDSDSKMGMFLLSNQTLGSWNNRYEINNLRRLFADHIWKSGFSELTL
ncbi:MAG: beta-lactamase family protein [Oligoflexia bacterium]|nr:beta-lactamase family protein [Oligoflexia bacterium]